MLETLGGRVGFAVLRRWGILTARNLPYSQLLPCEAESAWIARQLAAHALVAWGMESLTDSVVLCASELVANAVMHSDARLIRLTASRVSAGRVRVQVTGQGHTACRRGEPEPAEVKGHRMVVLIKLCDGMGMDRLPWGDRVWCEFNVDNSQKHAGRLERSSSPSSRSDGDGAC